MNSISPEANVKSTPKRRVNTKLVITVAIVLLVVSLIGNFILGYLSYQYNQQIQNTNSAIASSENVIVPDSQKNPLYSQVVSYTQGSTIPDNTNQAPTGLTPEQQMQISNQQPTTTIINTSNLNFQQNMWCTAPYVNIDSSGTRYVRT